MILRYFTPFLFLALVPLGLWLGGVWTFLGAALTPLGLVVLDEILGEDRTFGGNSSWSAFRRLPAAYVVLQLTINGWASAIASQASTGAISAVGLAISCGVTTGVFGFVAAHELIHSRNQRDRGLGLTFLASVFYMQFRIAHLYGHHRRAATFEDPASARLGEGLYAFLVRSIAGQFQEAWAFEARRSRGNRMVVYLAIEASLLVALAIWSGRALLFVLAVALVAVCLLEAFNYVAHYGLRRGPGERLQPHHSWNSERRMNNASLLNMGRHSDHHRRTSQAYETLGPVERSARLPAGYAAALLTALVPPLWRRVMDPRARAVMKGR